MSKKIMVFSITVVIFIAINLFLVYKDNTQQIDRVTFISDWTNTKEQEMRELLHTDGVLDYAEENLIYFDDSLGSFNEFLIEKGNVVEKGDALYSYDVHNFTEMMLHLNGQENELDAKIKAIKKAVSDMGSKQITSENFQFVNPDGEEIGLYRQNVTDAEVMKEQYIIDKEKELAETEAELASIKSQIEELSTGSGSITVESPYEGKVTQVETSLENPLITVEDAELYVTGELSEKERMSVQKKSHADITMKENNKSLIGTVISLDDEPKELDLTGESVYPFHIQLNEQSEEDDPKKEDNVETDENIDFNDSNVEDELLQGYHAEVGIILDRDPEAIVVPQKIMQQDQLWWMTRDGELIYLPVETGIHEDENIAIISDMIAEDDWIALRPKPQFRDGSHFITPLKPNKTNWKSIYNDGARKRSILIGLLGR